MTSPLTKTAIPTRANRFGRGRSAIARTAFDAALRQELHEAIQEAKRMASQIQHPRTCGIWNTT